VGKLASTDPLEEPAMKSAKPKVIVDWYPVRAEPSPSFKRLIVKLFANRKDKPTSTHKTPKPPDSG